VTLSLVPEPKAEPVTGADERKGSHDGDSDWLARFADTNPVFVLSLIGALAYFVARSAQTSFYNSFGVEPEDVGLGYTETLIRAAWALLALIIVVGAISFVLLHPWRYDKLRGKQERIGPWARWVGASTIFSLLVLAGGVPFGYDYPVDDVKNGEPVNPPGLALSAIPRFITNPLGLRVVKVHVSWIDEMHPAYDFRDEVMYLGRANGIAVFFDPTKTRTVRVPESHIVIERDS
jgi:hypothetical protein